MQIMVFFYYVKRVSWRTTTASSEGKRKMTLIKPILFFSEIRAVKATPSMMVPHFCQPRGDGHAHIGQHRRCHLACVRQTLPCPDISTGREKQYISQNLNGQKSQQCQHLANRRAHTESTQITEIEQLTTRPIQYIPVASVQLASKHCEPLLLLPVNATAPCAK